MSVLQKLQPNFNMLETIFFPAWQKATPKKRLQITKQLAKVEATMIIEEIENQAARKYAK